MTPVSECPACRAQLRVPDTLLGTQVKCPKCATVFVAGAAPVAPPAAPLSAVPPPPPAPPKDMVPANDWDRLHDEPLLGDLDLPAELPGKGKATTAMWLLGACIVADILNFGAAAYALSYFSKVVAGEVVDDAAELTNAGAAAATGCFTMVTALAAAVAFCMWFYTAYKNLRLFGVKGLKCSPGWAVASFFLPILNLYRPYQVAQEMYKASDDALPLTETTAWRRSAGSSLIGLWWTGWIITNVINQFLFRLNMRPDLTPDMEQAVAALEMLEAVVSIGTAVLAIQVVKLIRDRQISRFEQLATAQRGGLA